MSHDRKHADSVMLKLREKLLSVSDDYWIEDEHGNHVFKVDGKLMSVGKKAVLEDAQGHEAYTIQHKPAHLHRTFEITRGGQDVARVKEAYSIAHHTFHVERNNGHEYTVKGSIAAHKFEVRREHDEIAHATHQWLKIRDSMALEVFNPDDVAFVLALVVAVDMAERFGDADPSN